MFVSDNKIEQIKDSIDIVEFIGQYVSLVKRGKNYLGLCPFHNEKTPSFNVNPDGKYYKCFGCGVSGDVITFLQQYEGLDFTEAIKELAEKAHISLDEENVNVKKEDYSIYYNINKEAAYFFLENINKNNNVIDYLKDRNINPKSVIRFGLGYALDSWDGLYNHLLKKGFKVDDIERANLIQKSEKSGKYYDLFRKRLVFPILDLKSRVVGFSGRIIGDGEPKYYNSRDSVIFKKGNLLFGLNLVQKNSNRDKIMLVEGNVDVVKLHQMGINYVVAALGTAFTERQATLLKRYGKDIYLCLDGDGAGQKATMRDIEILKSIGVDPKVVIIPDNMDPDEYIDKFGVEKFNYMVENASSSFDFSVLYYKRDLDIENRDDFITFIRRLVVLLKTIPSKVERSVYIDDLSNRFNIDRNLLDEEIKINDEISKDNILTVGNYTVPKASNNITKILIRLILADKVFAIESEARNVGDFINNKSLVYLYKSILKEYEVSETIDVYKFKSKIISEGVIDESVINSIFIFDDDKDFTLDYLFDVIDGVKKEFINEEKNRIKNEIKSAQESGNSEMILKLLEKMDSLSKMDGGV